MFVCESNNGAGKSQAGETGHGGETKEIDGCLCAHVSVCLPVSCFPWE